MDFFMKVDMLVDGVLIAEGTRVTADYDELVEFLDDYKRGILYCNVTRGSLVHEFALERNGYSWPLLIEFLGG